MIQIIILIILKIQFEHSAIILENFLKLIIMKINKLINTDTLQNNGNDMITQQTNVNDIIETPKMKIHQIKVIVNKPYLLILNKFANVAQILLFWNTNKLKMVNKHYRKQYTANKKQRIYRIKNIIKAFHQ